MYPMIVTSLLAYWRNLFFTISIFCTKFFSFRFRLCARVQRLEKDWNKIIKKKPENPTETRRKKKTEIERMWWRKTCVDKYPLSLSDLSHLLHRSFDPCPHELAFPVCFRPDLDLLPCVTVDCFFGNFFFSSRKKRSLFVVLNLPQPVFLLTNCDYDNTEGSGMSLYNDHMATSNALRIGSPTGINSPAYRAGQSAPSTLGGVLRPQRSLDAIVDQSTTSSTSNLSHFGSSAIRFRSAQHHAGNDERLVSIFCVSARQLRSKSISARCVCGVFVTCPRV